MNQQERAPERRIRSTRGLYRAIRARRTHELYFQTKRTTKLRPSQLIHAMLFKKTKLKQQKLQNILPL
jgi:hypothetical protein